MTPERFARINQMLDRRQLDLSVCLEAVHKPHNLSAIIRTCDAIGIHEVHSVWTDDNMRLAGGTAMGSQNWVKVNQHNNIDHAFAALKQQNMQILATNLSATAVDFREIDYTRPTAIVMGQEKDGISDHALEMCDQDIIVPMVGMVQSLNVSVATALILYEAQRQRQAAGLYDTPSALSKQERDRVLFEGGHPIFAKACKRKGLAYPEIDDEGQIIADKTWWKKMQLDKSAWD